MMNLYNSLTHKKEELKTHEPGVCTMYTCGPTVYHFAHIGILRSYIMEDVLEKYINYTGIHVKRAMNITDVGHLSSDADTGEDKMLKGAKREHKTVMQIAKFYTDKFFEDCAELNIKKPEIVEPATHCIPEYIEMITRLLDNGSAYIAGGNVYFDTSTLKKYYVFNDHDEENLAVGVREGVFEDMNKRNKADFVLWFTKSKAYLGHAWCPHWFHVLHLNTTDGKMSKSKGEFLTLSLLKEKGYDPAVYRFFCLQSHYRKNLVFSYEGLDNATVAYKKLVERIAALNPQENDVFDENAATALREKFNDGMSTCLYDVLKYDTNDKTKRALIEEFDTVLSLNLCKEADALNAKAEEPSSDPDAARIEVLLAERAQAKKDRNFARADEIRDSLKAEGIVITDTPNGAKWERV